MAWATHYGWGDGAWADAPAGCACCNNPTGWCNCAGIDFVLFCCSNMVGTHCVKVIFDGAAGCSILTGSMVLNWDYGRSQYNLSPSCATNDYLHCLSTPHSYLPI